MAVNSKQFLAFAAQEKLNGEASIPGKEGIAGVQRHQRGALEVCFGQLCLLCTQSDSQTEVKSTTQLPSALDQEMPILLKVSRPILENVIFCHQEESNWPLQEGTVLKTKFDAIFQASRYSKALQDIRKQKKLQSDQEKTYHGDLRVASARLEQYKQLEDSLTTAQAGAHRLTADLNQAEEAAYGTQQQVQRLAKQLQSAGNLIAEKRSLQSQLQSAQQRRQRAAQALAESSADDVESILASADAILQQKDDLNAKLEAAEEEADAAATRLRSVQDQHGSLHRRHATAAAQLAAASERIAGVEAAEQALLTVAHSAQAKYNFKGWPSSLQAPLTPPTVQRLLTCINSAHAALQEAQTAAHRDANAQRKAATEASAGSAIQLSTTEQQQVELQQRLAAAQAQVRSAQAELSQLGGSSALRQRLTAVETAYEAAQTALRAFESGDSGERSAGGDKQVGTLQRSLDDVSEKLTAARNTVSTLRARSVAQVKLRSALEDAADARRKAWGRLQASREAVEAATGSTGRTVAPTPVGLTTEQWAHHRAEEAGVTQVTPGTVKRDVTAARHSAATRAETANKRLSTLQQAAYAAESAFKDAQRQSEASQACCRELLSQLGSRWLVDPAALPSGQLPEPSAFVDMDSKLADLQDDLDTAQAAASMGPATFQVLSMLKQRSEAKHACALCSTAMTDANEAGMIAAMERILRKNQQSATHSARAEALDAARAAVAEAQGAKTLMVQYAAAHEAWKAADDEVDAASVTHAECATKLGSAQSEAAEASAALQGLQAVVTMATEVNATWQAAEDKVAALDVQGLAGAAGGGGQSLESAEAAVAALEETRDSLERQLRSARDAREQLATRGRQLQDDVSDTRAKVLTLKEQLSSVDTLQRKVQEGEVLQAELSSKLSAMGSQLQQLRSAAAAAQAELANVEARVSAAVRKAEAAFAEVSTLRSDISAKAATLQQLTASDPRGQLEKAKMEASSAETALRECTAELTSAQEAKQEADSEAQMQRDTVRQVMHLQAVTDADDELKQVQARAAELDAAIAAAADGESDVQEKHDAAVEKLAKLRQEAANLEGRLAELEKQQAKVQSHMGEPQFKNVRLAHHKAQVDYTTAQVATKDLDKYYKAVEKALAQYHATKMRNINERVAELWRATYRGQDIESIELRSDAEEATVGSKDKKAFNYRVVMLKGGAELDMRGRCSAGQKVLASLVIRLALAETFSVQCGFMTLDEPTTNLDVENRTGLAQSICRLVAARRSQKNFQLVVITHDEDFVAELGRQQVELAGAGGDMTPFYYRVSRERNRAGQYVSRIDKFDFA